MQFIMITLAFLRADAVFFFAALKIYGGDDGIVIRRRNTLFDLNMRMTRHFYFLCLGSRCWYSS